MKTFKFLLVTVTSFLFFFSQSTLAVYDLDDVPNDTGEKTTTSNTEVEVNEFVLLDAMPDIELYYYPYSASDADAANGEDVPGGEGYLQLIKHKISNQVTVKNGEFILLGGMMQQSNITHTEGIPKLKNIPFLGRLFGQKKQRNSDYEVWIMIRPSILKK